MKALFADLSERTRQERVLRRAYQRSERQRVLALGDAIHIALAEGRHDRVGILMKEMHAIVSAALARRARAERRIDLPTSIAGQQSGHVL